MNVFVMEDEYWTRKLIIRFVEESGLGLTVVGEADNGKTGFDEILKSKPDILITDMKMPGYDGAEILVLIRENKIDVEIIVASGFADFNYTKQAIRTGAVEYLLKPIKKENLIDALKICVDNIHNKHSKTFFLRSNLPKEILPILNAYKSKATIFLMQNDFEGIKKELCRTEAKISNFSIKNTDVWFVFYQESILLLEDFCNKYNIELTCKPVEPQEEAVVRELLILYESVIGKCAQKSRRRVNVVEVYEYLKQHYTANINLSEVANIFGVTLEYLSVSYKNHHNENMSDTLKRFRMEKARELIESTNISFENISTMCGYSELSYFYKVFKKYYDRLPNSFRNKGQH